MPSFALLNQNTTLISKIPCSLSKTAIFTANYAKSAQFTNPYSDSRGISLIRAILVTLLFLFLDIRKTGSTPCLRKLRKSHNLKLEFAMCSLLYISQNVLY